MRRIAISNSIIITIISAFVNQSAVMQSEKMNFLLLLSCFSIFLLCVCVYVCDCLFSIAPTGPPPPISAFRGHICASGGV